MRSCPGPATVVFDPTLTEYDFGHSHPMSPVRVDLTMRLADSLGLVGERLRRVDAPMAADDLLALVHDEEYLAAVKHAGETGEPDERHGLGTDDNPVFTGMHHASAHVVGATVEACRQVWSGESLHGVNVTGGLHHAMAAAASGFCVYNDVAVGIAWLLENGASKVTYVDVDAHHGDGVERLFWNDPRVQTISLHETGQMLFPGTGFPGEVGGPDAEGTAINVALPPGTSDAGWLRAYHAVVPELVTAFEPDVLVTQHGCDSHSQDPLAHLMLSVDGQRASYAALHDLAHQVTDGRWVATGGGGYAVVDVVPRAWTHLLAIASGQEVDPSTPVPASWREYVEGVLGQSPPATMSDGRTPTWRDWESGYDPDSWLDRSIVATRDAVFPLYGLDPLH